MSWNKITIFFIISFLVGVFLANILFFFSLVIGVVSLSMMFLLGVGLLIKKHHFFIFIFGMGLLIGALFTLNYNQKIILKYNAISQFAFQTVNIDAEVKGLYKKNENSKIFIMKVNNINGMVIPVNFLLYLPKNSDLGYGQIVSIKSSVQLIQSFSDTFNYIKYMQSKNIYFQMYASQVDFIGQREITYFYKTILFVRNTLKDTIFNLYPSDEAILLSGILIGVIDDMSKEWQEKFSNSGLMHIVAVSGYNITILILFLGYLLKVFPLWIRSIIVIVSVIFFVSIVGDNIPAIRAGIMGVISYLILVLGRKTDTLIVLLFTLFILILYNPLYLNYDISFHLSFLAVVGLLYLQDFFKKIFHFFPKFMGIQESFIVTLSALIPTLPIMIVIFGKFPIWIFITNILVSPVIPFIMIFGVLSILFSSFIHLISFIFGLITYFFLKYILIVVDFFGGLSISVLHINISEFSLIFELFYFGILIFFILYFQKK